MHGIEAHKDHSTFRLFPTVTFQWSLILGSKFAFENSIIKNILHNNKKQYETVQTYKECYLKLASKKDTSIFKIGLH